MYIQTGTPGYKWRPGHREYKWPYISHNDQDISKKYKWRPGHRDTTTTGTPGGTGGYKWRPGHRDREWSISNYHQQSSRAIIRIMRYRSEYGLFSHGPLYVACSRVGKPDNLFICTDNGTAKKVVYSQVLRS